MVGRFLAYKAMNSVWRSATRRSRSSGAPAASPDETARLALAIMSYAGIFFGGVASCMAGSTVMLTLGFVLVWIIGPVVLFGIVLLPDRWFEAKRPLPEGYEETLGGRTTAQMVGVPVVMLLGIGTCFGGQPMLGTIIALGGGCLLFIGLAFAPVRWFRYRKVGASQNRNESLPKRPHRRAISFHDVFSGHGPSVHIRSVCPVCRKENLTAESISGIGWPRLTCECGAPYGALLKTPSVPETWAQYLLSDGQPGRLRRVPGAIFSGVQWDLTALQDGTSLTDRIIGLTPLILGLTPLKWCSDEKDAVLVIVPSEEAAAAILSASLLGYIPVSTPSSPLMAYANYSSFAGRDVIIWPDADKIAVSREKGEPIMRSPNYAVETGRRLTAVGAARVRVVDVSDVQKILPKDSANAAHIPPAKIADLLATAIDFEEAERTLATRISTLLLEQTPEGSEAEFSNSSEQVQPVTAELASTPEMNESASRPHVVYFIRERIADGKCKVGITTSLERRLRALQTGNPNQLEVVHTLEVEDRRTAEHIEGAVLNSVRGAGAELQGEWFENAIVSWAWESAQREYAREM